MKKRFIQILFIALGVIGFNMIGCQSDPKICSDTFPAHPITQGVSAPFAGLIGNWMVIGGGCNFPNVPAAEGGKKVYYNDIFICHTDADSLQWESSTGFPFPIAYGASVETEKGLICIGGMNEQSSLKEVFRLVLDQTTQQIIVEQLPSLPESIDNATATCIGNSLYVTGGNQGNGGNALYTLCLEKDSSWNKLADYPGAKRIQPVLLASDDALFLFGGFEVNAQKESIISSDFLVYHVKEDRWSTPQAVPSLEDGTPRALVGCAGTRANNQLFIAGGVNCQIFKAAVEGKAPADYLKRPAEWYQFSKDLLIYDLQTQEWSVVPETEGFNKAGGSLLHQEGSLFMVCGEIKPGIRTNEIVKKDLKKMLEKSRKIQ